MRPVAHFDLSRLGLDPGSGIVERIRLAAPIHLRPEPEPVVAWWDHLEFKLPLINARRQRTTCCRTRGIDGIGADKTGERLALHINDSPTNAAIV